MMETAEISQKNDTRKLPDGWRWVRLGDYVTKIGSGITPLGGNAVYTDSGIPLIRSQNIQLNHFAMDGLVYISKEQDSEMESSRVSPGDVLLNITGASIGRVCVVPGQICPANVNQHVCIIRCKQEIHPEFLSYFVSTPKFQDFIMDTQAGATRQALTKALIENFQIPLPPLSEQRRIAAILNEQMVAVERARSATQTQLKAAKALPAAYLRAVFNSPEVQKWPRRRLGDVCDFQGGTQPPKSTFKRLREPGYVRLIQIQDFKTDDYAVYVSDDLQLNKCEESDVLIGRYGASVGRILRGKAGAYNVALVKTLPNKTVISKDFLFYVLQGAGFQSLIREVSARAAQAGFNKGDVGGLEIPVPSLSEQQRVVAMFNGQMAAAERARKALEEQLDTINKLSAALLRRAFSGEL